MAKEAWQLAAEEAEKLRAGAKQEEDADTIVADDPDDGADNAPDTSGFLSYEEYVKAGKDPKKYKGEEAFHLVRELVENNKSLKKELKQVSQAVNETMDEFKAQETARIRAQLEAELKQQKADGLVDEALETKEKLDQLKQDVKKGGPQLPPVITDYLEDNPMLMAGSKEFNADVFEDFKLLYDSQITKLTNGTGLGLSDRQIERALKRAFDEAKEMNADAIPASRSPRNDRPGPTRRANGGDTGGKGQSLEVRLKNMQFGDNRNPDGNPHPAYAIYKRLKETDPKAAEGFARRTLGE